MAAVRIGEPGEATDAGVGRFEEERNTHRLQLRDDRIESGGPQRLPPPRRPGKDAGFPAKPNRRLRILSVL